jgi:GTP cyclohydrolase IA
MDIQETKRNLIAERIKDIIKFVGDDPSREGLIDTPLRIAKSYEEMFRGYDLTQKPKVTVFPNNKDGIKYNQMITDSGSFYSMCEHHSLPFWGEYHFAYIPENWILGLSKITREVSFFAAKWQIQERLTKEIVDDIEGVAHPKGIALILTARHLCKEMRGAKMIGGKMITSEMRGVFLEDAKARQEFLSLIKI